MFQQNKAIRDSKTYSEMASKFEKSYSPAKQAAKRAIIKKGTSSGANNIVIGSATPSLSMLKGNSASGE